MLTFMSEPNDNISRIVVTLLAAKGLRRADLAAHLGYSAPVITRRLNGETPWTITDVVKMSDYFEVGPAVFFGGVNDLIPELGDNLRHTAGYSRGPDELLMEAA